MSKNKQTYKKKINIKFFLFLLKKTFLLILSLNTKKIEITIASLNPKLL